MDMDEKPQVQPFIGAASGGGATGGWEAGWVVRQVPRTGAAAPAGDVNGDGRVHMQYCPCLVNSAWRGGKSADPDAWCRSGGRPGRLHFRAAPDHTAPPCIHPCSVGPAPAVGAGGSKLDYDFGFSLNIDGYAGGSSAAGERGEIGTSGCLGCGVHIAVLHLVPIPRLPKPLGSAPARLHLTTQPRRVSIPVLLAMPLP